jgi:hypothetical protein
MQHPALVEIINQYNRKDLAFFELMSSIAEIHTYQHELSAEEITQLQIGARTLNGIIARNTASNHSMQLV